MEGFPPDRPSGAADLPSHRSHPSPHHPPYWYPPPPPSSSSPSPSPQPPPYAAPPYHQYPPPPQSHQQWPPPPPPHQPYAPAPPQPYSYPPAHGPAPFQPMPPPPHQMPPYPPQQMPPPHHHQAWPNQPWPPNQQHHYPGAGIPQNEGEDWAAKAKAWATANSTTGRPVDHSYLQHKEGTHANGETLLASSQKINAAAGGGVAAADSATLVSPVKNHDSFPIYEQEVPSYSSSQGNKDVLPRYDNTQDHQPFAAPPVQDRYHHTQPDPTYMVNYGHNTHSSVGVAGHDAGAAPHLWAPPGSMGPYPPPALPPLPAQQYDMPPPVHASIPVPNYGPPNISPGAFNAPPVASHLNTELYHGDPSASNQANPSKKPAVPSWLREEILKNKTTMGSNASAQPRPDGGDRSPEATDQTDSKSVDSTRSAEEEDDEDEVEAARTAAINQEIKRVLTEVLLKVTDDLFDEIATKVLNEDEMDGNGEPTDLVKSKSHSSAPSTSDSAKIQIRAANGSAATTKAVVPDESTKGGGILLGLLDYDTDDDGDDENASTDNVKQNLETDTSNLNSLIQKDVLSDEDAAIHEESTELNLKREDAEDHLRLEGVVNMKLEEEIRSKEESHVEVETSQVSIGEVPHDRFVDGNGNIEKSKRMINSKDGERSKEGNTGGLRDEEEKNIKEKDEMNGDIMQDRRQITRGDDRETERRDDKENKLDGLKDSRREISKEAKDKMTEKDGKEDKREKSRQEKERKTERSDNKDDSSKDRRERSKEEKERRADRRDDGDRSLKGKSERSKEEKERETDKKDDKERSRRRKRSQSPRGRSRSREHPRASREHTDRRRRTESNKRSMSRSPPRSRHRRDSRSPHSKHSHHRNSAYSTTDRRRSRSRTPPRRRRSRSRTPSRRR